MKYLQLFVFPVLLSIYGIVFEERREGYQMIVGVLLTLIAVGGSILAGIFAYLLRNKKWSDTWYSRIGLSVLGCVVMFVLLFVYSQIQSQTWITKPGMSGAIR